MNIWTEAYVTLLFPCPALLTVSQWRLRNTRILCNITSPLPSKKLFFTWRTEWQRERSRNLPSIASLPKCPPHTSCCAEEGATDFFEVLSTANGMLLKSSQLPPGAIHIHKSQKAEFCIDFGHSNMITYAITSMPNIYSNTFHFLCVC